MISRKEALRLIENTSKYSHSLDVSAIMSKMAEELGEDKEKWEVVGLLHDLDYDQVRNDMSRHGIVASETLSGRIPEDCLYAIKSHDYRTGFKPKAKLDIALIIADSLAILIERIKDRETLDVEILKEEVERVSAKAPWYKENLLKSGEINLSMRELLKLAIEAARKSS